MIMGVETRGCQNMSQPRSTTKKIPARCARQFSSQTMNCLFLRYSASFLLLFPLSLSPPSCSFNLCAQCAYMNLDALKLEMVIYNNDVSRGAKAVAVAVTSAEASIG